MTKKYVVDTTLASWFHNEQLFKESRNRHMAQRIGNYAKGFPGKKIVVLTGLSHKHYLENALRKMEKDNAFEVVNFN